MWYRSWAMWDILIFVEFWGLFFFFFKTCIQPTNSAIPTRLSRRHTNTQCFIPGGRAVLSIMAHNFLKELWDIWKRLRHNHIQNVCVVCHAINGGWFLKASRKNNGLKNISMQKLERVQMRVHIRSKMTAVVQRSKRQGGTLQHTNRNNSRIFIFISSGNSLIRVLSFEE